MNWLLGSAEEAGEQPAAGNGAPKKAAAPEGEAPDGEGEAPKAEKAAAKAEKSAPAKGAPAKADKGAPAKGTRELLLGMAEPDEQAVRALMDHVARALDAVPRIESAAQPIVGMLQAIAKAAARSDQDRKQQFTDLRAHITVETDRLAEAMRRQIAEEAAIEVWRGFAPALDEIDHVLRETALGEARGVDSIRLVRRKLRDALSRLGIEEITVEERVTPFDPEIHEGKPHEGDDEALPDGTIVRLERTGYIAGERVLRCALVTVKKG
ncbi:MAG: nucleotide exchange factor GrpE [Minicystis sp.]